MNDLGVCMRGCVYYETLYTPNPNPEPFLLNDSLNSGCMCVSEGEVVEAKKKEETKNTTAYTLTYTPQETISFG